MLRDRLQEHTAALGRRSPHKHQQVEHERHALAQQRPLPIHALHDHVLRFTPCKFAYRQERTGERRHHSHDVVIIGLAAHEAVQQREARHLRSRGRGVHVGVRHAQHGGNAIGILIQLDAADARRDCEELHELADVILVVVLQVGERDSGNVSNDGEEGRREVLPVELGQRRERLEKDGGVRIVLEIAEQNVHLRLTPRPYAHQRLHVRREERGVPAADAEEQQGAEGEQFVALRRGVGGHFAVGRDLAHHAHQRGDGVAQHGRGLVVLLH